MTQTGNFAIAPSCGRTGQANGRKRRVHQHDKGRFDDARDRCDIADEIEIEIVIERRIYRARRTSQEDRVAIRRCAHDRLNAYIGTRARPVLNSEWLSEPLRQPLSDQAREDFERTAGSGRHDARPVLQLEEYIAAISPRRPRAVGSNQQK